MRVFKDSLVPPVFLASLADSVFLYAVYTMTCLCSTTELYPRQAET